jgi:predicted DCC family thiol-disulfide oxidoreductase YuxK
MAKLEVYYNSACPVCDAGIKDSRKRVAVDAVAWKDIATDKGLVDSNLVCEIGAELDKVRHSLHVRDEMGAVFVGADAVARLMLETPGQKWLGRLLMTPALRPIARWLYDRFADRLYAWNRKHGRW